jgi:hypothetical protein
MDLPGWILEAVRDFKAPDTGQVTIVLERYCGGVTQVEIGGIVRLKPPKTK